MSAAASSVLCFYFIIVEAQLLHSNCICLAARFFCDFFLCPRALFPHFCEIFGKFL